jgi:hypothetical protein
MLDNIQKIDHFYQPEMLLINSIWDKLKPTGVTIRHVGLYVTYVTNSRFPPVHYTQTNTKNVSKAWALLQTTGGKDGPNIFYMRKS